MFNKLSVSNAANFRAAAKFGLSVGDHRDASRGTPKDAYETLMAAVASFMSGDAAHAQAIHRAALAQTRSVYRKFVRGIGLENESLPLRELRVGEMIGKINALLARAIGLRKKSLRQVERERDLRTLSIDELQARALSSLVWDVIGCVASGNCSWSTDWVGSEEDLIAVLDLEYDTSNASVKKIARKRVLELLRNATYPEQDASGGLHHQWVSSEVAFEILRSRKLKDDATVRKAVCRMFRVALRDPQNEYLDMLYPDLGHWVASADCGGGAEPTASA